jgi:hypothetical protein
MPQNLPDIDKPQEAAEPYAPDGEEKQVLTHLTKRIATLKKTKKDILDGMNFEEMMKDADTEYQPKSLREKKDESKSIMLIQDEIKGMRGSRIVPITGTEGQEWRSDVSEPTLLVKIQTAISILIDQNPEAVFKAVLDKYKETTPIAEAIWRRSWGLANSKEQLKNFVFNLAKYGWAPGRTYPRLVQYPKQILTELDVDHPEKNKYKDVVITEFNDIYREALDPWRTWIDDMANLYDPFSLNDWYFEKDYDKDTFDLEFGMYENHDKVTAGAPYREKEGDDEDAPNDETKERDDVVTVGFYENKKKDLYALWIPKDKVVLYHSPLPNDEGMLTLWDACWNIRDPRTRYGIGLFEILKNDKVMYDRLNNMDMDALVLSIYTMLFYSGSNQQVGDGVMTISPGVMKQKLPGTTIDQVKIEYSGKGREGAQNIQERMDENTGITPTLQGQVEGKTLGEVLHAKDAALKRMNIPLSNIATGFIERDAYLTLSWANQVYSLPEVMEFASEDDLQEYMEETDREPEQQSVDEETGAIVADFPRVLELGLETDRDDTLIESPDNRFFVVGGKGKDGIAKKSIKWKGRITVNPQSIIAPSQELDRQRKLELFNVVEPVAQGIAQAMMEGSHTVALAMALPVMQILEIQNEKPDNWLPKEVIDLVNNPEQAKKMEAQMVAQQETAMQEEQPLLIDPNNPPPTPEEAAGGAPMPSPPTLEPTPGVVPRDDITNPVADTVSEIGKVR